MSSVKCYVFKDCQTDSSYSANTSVKTDNHVYSVYEIVGMYMIHLFYVFFLSSVFSSTVTNAVRGQWMRMSPGLQYILKSLK